MEYEVIIKEKKSLFTSLDKDLFFTERFDHYDKKTIVIETFSRNWFIGLIQENCHLVSIRSGNKIIPFTGPTGILIPPNIISEWHLQKGDLHWLGFFSKSPLPFPESDKSVLFRWNRHIPQSYKEVLNLLSHIQIQEQITEGRDNSWVSTKVKSLIDRSFTEDIKIEEIAKKLGINRSTMARSFKKTYGLSPVAYRHQLRVFEGLKLINQEQKEITTAALATGFASLNRFEHHFKEIFDIPPRDFSFANKTLKK